MLKEDPISAAITEIVDAGSLGGAVSLVWRGGKIVQCAAVGQRDLETGAPMTRDTLFRIASMSKPVTSTAALMLFDEGRFALDEPITEVAPEFSSMRVLSNVNGPLADTVAAERPITFGDLLTHRAGLTYGGFHSGPIAEAYAQALGADIDSVFAPDDWIARLATLPLIGQPGATLTYGHATDLLGLLISRMEGAPLGEVLQRRIFGPLGMVDTSFVVPREKRGRRAGNCGFDAAGSLIARAAPGDAFLVERPDDMTYVSGGAGLWSTVDDYLAFARTFLGDGVVRGVQLLTPQTRVLMTANHLTPHQRATSNLIGSRPFAAGHGFGLGVAVVLEPDQAPVTRCKGAVGTVGWPGAYGGWWQADPRDDSIMIFLTHNMFELDQLLEGIGLGAFAAVERVHALASAMPR